MKKRFRPISYVVMGLLMGATWLLPLALPRAASAAQITSRKLTISSGVPSATGVTYSYSFSLPSNTNVQSMQFQACAVAVGTCGTVAGININQGTQQGTNGFTSTTAFTRDATGGGGCTPGNQVLCVKRTQATAETGAKTIAWNTQTNPSTANTAFFVRITTYSDTGWTTAVDTGTVASAVAQSLTVNAAVAEILNFCIGSTAVDDATTSVASDCTGVSGTSVNLGTLDPTAVNITPVSTNGGDSKNAVAMVRTNAASGVSISYDAIQQSGTNHQGTLRISGATCSASSGPGTGSGGTPPAASGPYTDQCIDAAGATQNVFSAGTEQFGMTVAGVNCGSTTSYTCTYSSSATNLTQGAQYIGGSNNHTYGASASKGFAWDESGTAQTIASSPTVVDDEALILKFAATPSITTPFGAYTAQSDFIAVPTY